MFDGYVEKSTPKKSDSFNGIIGWWINEFYTCIWKCFGIGAMISFTSSISCVESDIWKILQFAFFDPSNLIPYSARKPHKLRWIASYSTHTGKPECWRPQWLQTAHMKHGIIVGGHKTRCSASVYEMCCVVMRTTSCEHSSNLCECLPQAHWQTCLRVE